MNTYYGQLEKEKLNREALAGGIPHARKATDLIGSATASSKEDSTM